MWTLEWREWWIHSIYPRRAQAHISWRQLQSWIPSFFIKREQLLRAHRHLGQDKKNLTKELSSGRKCVSQAPWKITSENNKAGKFWKGRLSSRKEASPGPQRWQQILASRCPHSFRFLSVSHTAWDELSVKSLGYSALAAFGRQKINPNLSLCDMLFLGRCNTHRHTHTRTHAHIPTHLR